MDLERLAKNLMQNMLAIFHEIPVESLDLLILSIASWNPRRCLHNGHAGPNFIKAQSSRHTMAEILEPTCFKRPAQVTTLPIHTARTTEATCFLKQAEWRPGKYSLGQRKQLQPKAD